MFQDPRDFQICFLSLFLGLGLWLKDWTLRPDVIFCAIATCLIVQSAASLLQVREASAFSLDWVGSLRSALITGISLSLLLRTDHWYTMVFAASVAILSKFSIRVKDKHLFNPANAGIIATLVLTQDAWVSPGQWGELGWYAIAFLGAGGIVLGRVGRWDTSAMFLATYGGLMVGRDCWLGWSWDVASHHLSSGSLLLFALFMITDPRSIPDGRWSRMLWAACVGGLTFVLQTVFIVPIAVFWSLFCLAPLTPLLDSLQATQRFQWQSARPASQG
ncbi:RnfABCDGE type electron transport complex subunit D [Altericista sp. CCNU0014]|uniref:RnfABCDGE type electron transport complex subunit D n=1 Tax=Altericista sp. CCNU0014 TaxID=3082949 RepID=UPI00384EDBA5